eukprot:8081151-Alexandrium_andersonii.AAC.1
MGERRRAPESSGELQGAQENSEGLWRAAGSSRDFRRAQESLGELRRVSGEPLESFRGASGEPTENWLHVAASRSGRGITASQSSQVHRVGHRLMRFPAPSGGAQASLLARSGSFGRSPEPPEHF